MILQLISDPQVIEGSGKVTTLLDLLMKGGIIMIPILLLSVFSIYLFIERYAYIRRTTAINFKTIDPVMAIVKKGDREQAMNLLKSDTSSIGRILESGIEMTGRPLKEVESSLETTTNLEITKMEKNTGYLGIIAGIAPMLGFIGTISGVIKIFYNISLADNISIGIIAGGLYQKMICSGTGLIVGVLAYTGYHILHMMIDRYTIRLQENLIKFLKAF